MVRAITLASSIFAALLCPLGMSLAQVSPQDQIYLLSTRIFNEGNPMPPEAAILLPWLRGWDVRDREVLVPNGIRLVGEHPTTQSDRSKAKSQRFDTGLGEGFVPWLAPGAGSS